MVLLPIFKELIGRLTIIFARQKTNLFQQNGNG